MVLEQCRIRPMLKADLAVVCEIEQNVFPFPWGEAIFADCLDVGYQCQVVEYQQHVIAYAIVMVVLDESHLLTVAVSPLWQRQGVARWFMEQLIQQLLQDNIRLLFLEVRQSNRAAIYLYEQLGFTQTGLRPRYYPTDSGREDALLFTKPMYIS